MSKTPFYKYQGTGNDFVILEQASTPSIEQIQQICDRKFGIGADGLIIMQNGEANHFDMMYYNADGTESFCGNGSRCSVMHAYTQGWGGEKCTFNSNDGLHEAIVDGDLVHLKMHDVSNVVSNGKNFILNTGSPHFITFTDNIDIDIIPPAHQIRYSDRFKKEGINVNFIKSFDNHLGIRTYERGVEDETLSCGTGVTAAVIAEYAKDKRTDSSFARKVKTRGGELAVSFDKTTDGFENIYLIGPAVKVFEGDIYL